MSLIFYYAKRPLWFSSCSLLLLLILLIYSSCFLDNQEDISYNTQIKPILNKHCIHCHGGVKESGGLSLMTRELALRKNDSGKAAILPGNAKNSEFIRRLHTNDPEERMPFEAPSLHPDEIALLEKWIDQGANWQKHWAYLKVQKPIPPSIAQGNPKTFLSWAKNDIDHFILSKMIPKGLQPNPPENKAKLLRRLALDLTGLPPDQTLTQQFLRDNNPLPYEQVVDSLLASPHFGEHWSALWLDLARYADSKGFERDASRTIWSYRDYVIQSFNADLPYDQFLIEQLAGDLLPEPTDQQYIATGFHRNTPTNDEGGTNNEEYRVAATLDRVNTTYEALLGTTFACTQCHGHPYDPFPHDDYYKSLAFFNNTRDHDTHRDYPWLRQFSEEEQAKLADLTQWIAKVENPERAKEIRTFLKTYQPTYYSLECDSLVNAALYDTKYLGFRQDGIARLKAIPLSDRSLLTIKTNWFKPGGKLDIYLNDPAGMLLASWDIPTTKTEKRFFEIPLQIVDGKHDLYFHYHHPNLKDLDAAGLMIDWFYFSKLFPGPPDNYRSSAEQTSRQQTYRELLQSKTPHTLIMIENEAERQRFTYVFDRGNWQVPLAEVKPEVPGILPSLPENNTPNRLSFAKWVVDPDHPLTSRVFVNRIWAKLFGKGIVLTLEDFGSQGTPPSHPALLDWLAWDFVHDKKWSSKQLIKLIVTSATYQQSALTDQKNLALDPQNVWLARGPRVRLSAEQVRDQALAISGLLDTTLFGPPVMPYQPAGIWQVPYNAESWNLSEGTERYRRAIYTFMKRSAPYPSFETFDLAPRQVCVSRRIPTNTPLQALVTLNDPVFVEAAQHFAKWMLENSPTNSSERIQAAYYKMMGQEISVAKRNILDQLYKKSKDKYQSSPEEVDKLLLNEAYTGPKAEFAATVVLANAMLNLDECLMK